MGNFEKLVVLAVLLVAAIVLAISFNRGGDEVEAKDPLSGAREVLEQDGVLPVTLPEGTSPPSSFAPGETLDGRTETSLLLDAGGEEPLLDTPAPAGLQPAAEGTSALALEPVSDRTQRILGTTLGLRPSFLDDYMVYTLAEGDTWPALAQRFYQDGRFTRNLLQANDNLAELAPGKEILVPIYDFFAPEAEPALEPSTAAVAGASAAPSAKPLEVTPVSPARALEYEVRPGDTLSEISLAVFGSASRWNELLEANRDKLRSPEALQVGMKLRIPEGGKLPTPAAAKPVVAKKPEAKPAKAEAKSATAPKKKKVL